MQCCSDAGLDGSPLAAAWEKYRRDVNPGAYLYSIDMAGYGTAQSIPGYPHTDLLPGWSESVLNLVRHCENGRSAVDVINERW